MFLCLKPVSRSIGSNATAASATGGGPAAYRCRWYLAACCLLMACALLLAAPGAAAKEVRTITGQELNGKIIERIEHAVKLPDGTTIAVVIFDDEDLSFLVFSRALVRINPAGDIQTLLMTGDMVLDSSSEWHEVEVIWESVADEDGNVVAETTDTGGNAGRVHIDPLTGEKIQIVGVGQSFADFGVVTALGPPAFKMNRLAAPVRFDDSGASREHFLNFPPTDFLPRSAFGTGDVFDGFRVDGLDFLNGPLSSNTTGYRSIIEADVTDTTTGTTAEAIVTITDDEAAELIEAILSRRNSPAPGFGAGVEISRFTSTSLHHTVAAVLGRVFGTGISSVNDEVVWWCDLLLRACELVLQEGAAAPGLPDVVLRFLGAPVVFNDWLLMMAVLDGPGVDSTNDRVLLLIDRFTGALHIVAREGDDFAGGVIREFLTKAFSDGIPLVTVQLGSFQNVLARVDPAGLIPLIGPGTELTLPDGTTGFVVTITPIPQSSGDDGRPDATAGGGFAVIAHLDDGRQVLLVCDCIDDTQCPEGSVCVGGSCVTTSEPPVLSLEKDVAFVADNDGDGAPTLGDVLEYTVVVTNTGAATDEVVTVEDILADPNISLLAGSVFTNPAGATIVSGGQPGDTAVIVEFPGIGANGQVRVTYRVTITGGLPGDVIENCAETEVVHLEELISDSNCSRIQIGRTFRVLKRDLLDDDVDGDGAFDPGDAIRYEITIEPTTGGLLEPAVVFEDFPDPRTDLVAGTVTTTHGTVVAGNGAGDGSVRVEIDDVTNPPPPVVIGFVARIREDAADPPILNQGVVTGGFQTIPTDDPDIAGDDDPTETPFELPPVAVCSLSPASDTNELGTLHTVTVQVVRGLDPIAGVAVDFEILSGPNGGLMGSAVTDLAGMAQFSWRGEGGLGQDLVQASGIADGEPFECEATKDWVATVPDVSLGKQVVAPLVRVLLGDTVTYRLFVTNLGGANTGVIVRDPIPAGAVFLPPAQPSRGDVICSLVAGEVVCTIGAMADGEVVTIDLRFTANALGDLCNSAEVSADRDRDPDNNRPEAPACIPVVAASDLAWTKTVDRDFARPDETLTYTIEVRNAGAVDATGVVITDFLPRQDRTGALQVEVVDRATTRGAFRDSPPEGSEIVDAGTLAPGEDVVVTLVVRPLESARGELCNVADVRADQIDTIEANNGDDPVCTPVPHVDLAIVKDGPSRAEPGEPISYTITVANNGPDDAAGVAVSDLLPSNARFISAASTKGLPVLAGGAVIVDIGTLAAQEETVTITIVVEAMLETDRFCNLAAVSGTAFDDDLTNNSSSSCAAVEEPRPSAARLDINKFDLSDPVLVGEEFTYVIRVQNLGTEAAENVIVTDPLPPQVAFVSAQATRGSFAVVDEELRWDIGFLASKAEIRVRVRALVAGAVRNTATVTSDEDQASVTESTRITVTPEAVHDLAITRIGVPKLVRLEPDTAELSERHRIAVTIQNRSPHAEVIDSLDGLVELHILALNHDGATAQGEQCVHVVPTLLGAGAELPVVVAPKEKLNVFFEAVFNCPLNGLRDKKGNNAAVDYKVVGRVNHMAIDGETDTHPEDDDCPRMSPSSLPEIDPNPDGTIEDRSCREDIFIDVFNPRFR